MRIDKDSDDPRECDSVRACIDLTRSPCRRVVWCEKQLPMTLGCCRRCWSSIALTDSSGPNQQLAGRRTTLQCRAGKDIQFTACHLDWVR